MTSAAMDGTQPRWVVVTGAAGGIGRALVAAFAGAGYHVIATDIAPPPAELACTHYLQADLARTVRDEAYAAEVFARIGNWLEGAGLHALVHNAALQLLGGIDTLSRQQWAGTLDVNLMAPFFWTQALLSHLELVRGSVVMISSIHARLTKPDFVAYATSKAALSGMARALAVDLRGRIRINAIEPAAVDTSMLRAGFLDQPGALARVRACHPIGRLALPQEIARATLLLVDGGLDFLHGTCLGVDGGISAVLHDTT
jgi:NAD(P)-dependent dehydrogenase (short-subunit alcohol dehydrogenase family)